MKLIILDRDGVINEDSDAYVKSADEWQAIPGSIEAIVALSKAGWEIAVATNQSGVGRGLFSLNDLEAMHEKFREVVYRQGGKAPVIFFCPHHPDENCRCRKPRPGLLYQIRDNLATNLKDVPVVGDSYRDLEAAQVAGCQPILVLTGKGQSTLDQHRDTIAQQGIPVYKNLQAVTQALINNQLH